MHSAPAAGAGPGQVDGRRCSSARVASSVTMSVCSIAAGNSFMSKYTLTQKMIILMTKTSCKSSCHVLHLGTHDIWDESSSELPKSLFVGLSQSARQGEYVGIRVDDYAFRNLVYFIYDSNVPQGIK